MDARLPGWMVSSWRCRGRNSSRCRAVGRQRKTRRPISSAPSGRAATALFLAEDDDHDDRVPRALQDLVGLEAEEPLDELEAARQLDDRLQFLRKDHARQVGLPVEPAGAVLDGLERHALAEDLRDWI